MNKKDLSLHILHLSFILPFLFTFPCFAQEEPVIIQKSTDYDDFISGKNWVAEFGLSAFMLQGKGTFLLNDQINPFFRIAAGLPADRIPQYLSSTGFSLDAGILDNFIITKWKTYLNTFYIKAFIGGTKTQMPEYSIFPSAGVGLGFRTINKFIVFSLGVDLGSSFQYFPGSGLGGVIFLRPEINLGFAV
jgi:hypothetical protein